MRNNQKILHVFFLLAVFLIMANSAIAFPITGKVIEISASETLIEQIPIKEEPIIIIDCEMCEDGIATGKVDNNGCPIYTCQGKEEPICPKGCVCKGNTIACPTLQEKPIEVEISTSEGISIISIEKVSEDSISIKERQTSIKTSKKLIIEEKKLLMETSQGNKEVKVMPSTASEIAINQLKLKNYEIELKDVGKPIYEVIGKEEVKIIGLFKTEMLTKTEINAETGSIGKTQKPWWSFLAKE